MYRGDKLKIKTLALFSYEEDNIQTNIKCLINSNESFENRSRISHINKSNIQSSNNKQRRYKYKLNKERKERLEIELDKGREELENKSKELERIKQMERDRLRYESMTEEINIDNELEDMESYI